LVYQGKLESINQSINHRIQPRAQPEAAAGSDL
jgi:hypothetical protein